MRIRYAIRSLARTPAFSIGCVLCLSLGLALTIAAFSIINAVLFRSMPGIQAQSDLRHLWMGAHGEQGPEVVPPSADEYETFRTSLADVATVTAAVHAPVAAGAAQASPVVTRAVFATPNYFAVLGTTPVIGALLLPAEGDGAVVSERLWRTHFGARAETAGQVLFVNGQPFEVAGVVPAKFVGASPGELDTDPSVLPSVWLPLTAHSRVMAGVASTRPPYLRMTARLAPGTSEETLAARAQAIAAAVMSRDGAVRPDAFVRVRPIHRGPYDDASDIALAASVVMIVPLGILGIGCANVANLLLARGASRSREIAVRLALGASRSRIVSELLTESLLLATAAATAAVALCAMAMQLSEQWMPLPLAVDLRVVGFAATAAFLTALLFGLFPAVNLAASRLTLRMHDVRPVRPRTRRLLAGIQLALSTALLVIAALFIRSVTRLDAQVRSADEHVLTASFAVQLARYDRARTERFERDLLERVRTVQGVGDAGVGPNRQREPIVVRVPGTQRELPAGGGAITDGWLRAAGWTLIAGRDFAPQERRGAPAAAIISDTMARRIAPDGNALGMVIVVSRPGNIDAPRYDAQIVGVVASNQRTQNAREGTARIFLPTAISDVDERTLWVRTDGPASGLAPTVRAMAAEIAPTVPLTDVGTVAEARLLRATPYRWLARGMSAAGVLALLLAAFGLFSLLTYLVAQRQRELGIRLTLGATRRDIVRLLLGESAAVAAAGAIAGGICAALGAQVLQTMFANVGTADPVAYAAAAGVLITAALAASAHPAWRASRTDPAQVLRAE